MRFSSITTAPGRALAAVALLLSATGSVEAVPIFTGNGVTTSVRALGQYDQHWDGSPAFLAAAATVDYSRTDYSAGYLQDVPASVPVSVMAYAAATPSSAAAHLVELRSYVMTPNPGETIGPRWPVPDVSQRAEWWNVVATVHSPDGAPTPGSIRLGFELAYTSPDEIRTDPILARLNLYNQTLYMADYRYTLGGAGSTIQYYGDGPAELKSDGLLHEHFHIDLALSATGVSDQFSLGLGAEIPGFLSNQALNNVNEMTLSLDGITLPDGTGLEAAGYTIGFEGGVPTPPPSVPEPATWLAWTLLAAGGARAIHRRRAA